MEIANVSITFAMLREHIQLFAVLLLALPLVSFLCFEFWIAARASKTQRTTNWFFADDLESDAPSFLYRPGHRTIAFARAPRRLPVRRPRSRNQA